MTNGGDRFGILILDGAALAMAGFIFSGSGPWEDACGPYGVVLLAGAAGLGLYVGPSRQRRGAAARHEPADPARR